MKPKKQGLGLEMHTFQGRDKNRYLVYRTTGGSYHVFVEIEAKDAARQCGATKEGTPRQMWGEIWKRLKSAE